jgi:CMP-N-acetylneuraminic acid synthetase
MIFVALIPARGGSKEIKNKNIKLINGKPLIYYSIKEVSKVKIIKNFFVTSDSNKILSISKKLGAKIIKRPKTISTSATSMTDVLRHAKLFFQRNAIIYDAIILLQPTSPLRNFKHIKKAINIFAKARNADCLVSCVRVPHQFTPNSLMRLKKNYLTDYVRAEKKTYLRQNKEQLFARNGPAIYIVNKKFDLNRNKSIYAKKTILFEMDQESSLDIDSAVDLRFFKSKMKK